jgi:hypothetical protein
VTAAFVDSSTERNGVDNVLATRQDHAQQISVGNESIQAVVAEHHADKLEAISYDASRPAAVSRITLSESNALAPRAFYGSQKKLGIECANQCENFQLAQRKRRVPSRFAE